MGIYAFVVDWYGPRRPFLDRSTALLQRIASEQHFHIALMYDETQDDNGHATDDAMEAMELAYQKYIGPGAPGRDAYLLYHGRPVIFVFPKHGHTDWDQVRQAGESVGIATNSAVSRTTRHRSSPKPSTVSTRGCIPGAKGGARTVKRGAKITCAISTRRCEANIRTRLRWAGCGRAFNDAKASWSLNRHIDARCGKTFEDTLRLFDENNGPSHPIPFVLIASWNDYEEGTAIERGLPHCDESKGDVAHGAGRP